MNLDPTLAFTAVIELRPGRTDSRELTAALTEAMTKASPPDRWAFARAWLDEHAPVNNPRVTEAKWDALADWLRDKYRTGRFIHIEMVLQKMEDLEEGS